MCNLIHANIKRIWKTRAFRICAAFLIVLAIFRVMMLYRDYVVCQGSPYFDANLVSVAGVGIFPLAAFIALYIGTEYSEGTIRNKIVTGLGR